MANIKLIEQQDAQAYYDFHVEMSKQTDYLLLTQDEVGALTVDDYKKVVDRSLNLERNVVFVAKDEEKIAGAIWVQGFKVSKMKHIACFGIGVLKQYQNQSIASQLYRQAELYLKCNGVERIQITVIDENTQACKFYKKLGFEVEGELKKSVYMNNKYYNEIQLAKFIL
jgi:ribosomal protein S18 acetylase RimI-like enzyme